MADLERVLVTGGGTAGHVIPAKPLIERLQNAGASCVFVGSKSGFEQSLISDLQIPFVGVSAGKLRRYLSFANFIDAFRVPIGILQALVVMWRYRPQVVFSKGGYVAFPVVVAAWLARVPVVAHESDLTPGLANRLCKPFLHTLCVNFTETQVPGGSFVVSGTPLRVSLTNGCAVRGREWLRLTSEKPVLLIVGGSLGAEPINAAVRGAREALVQDFEVVHVCGRGKLDETGKSHTGYQQHEFIDTQWGDVLAAADFVVSRAGANTLYELLALRKPNLLIPLTRAASRGDQLENADMASRHRWSAVLSEEELSPERLHSAITELTDPQHEWARRLGSFPVIDSLGVLMDALRKAARTN